MHPCGFVWLRKHHCYVPVNNAVHDVTTFNVPVNKTIHDVTTFNVPLNKTIHNVTNFNVPTNKITHDITNLNVPINKMIHDAITFNVPITKAIHDVSTFNVLVLNTIHDVTTCSVILKMALFIYYRFIYRGDRVKFIKNHLHQMNKTPTEREVQLMHRFLDSYLKQDGAFLLRLIAHNTNNITVTEITCGLWDIWQERDLNRSTGLEETPSLSPSMEKVPLTERSLSSPRSVSETNIV